MARPVSLTGSQSVRSERYTGIIKGLQTSSDREPACSQRFETSASACWEYMLSAPGRVHARGDVDRNKWAPIQGAHLPMAYGVGITAFTWLEYVLSTPEPLTAVVT